MTTRFALGDIRPNPFRNIERYPIDRVKVAKLKESIGRTEFWDNLVARVVDGTPEIAYGHHRMVALRELYPTDHQISLIVRGLDDASMLHVMADENMQEWASTSAVVVETVRAVRDFLLSVPVGKANRDPRALNSAKSNGSAEIIAFLGWPEQRVENALAIIRAEEVGELEPEDTADLSLSQADVMRREVGRQIKDPAVRRMAIARVRSDLREERIGRRGIGDVVAEVRQASSPRPAEPVRPWKVARAIATEIGGFWRSGTTYDTPTGPKPITRAEIIKFVAENRDAVELQGVGDVLLAEQIARNLDEMAATATRFAALLREEPVRLTDGVRS